MAIDTTKKTKVSLSKVVLQKSGDSTRIDLSKSSDQNIIINLNWTQQTRGWLFSKDIDLDLGCYYELIDGQVSAIDGLQFAHGKGGPRNQQTRQGCYTRPPYIWHCGDDRGLGSSSGENILINPQGINYIKRIIVYCFIYEGVAMWSESDAVITVKVPNNPEIVVEMGNQTDQRSFCAIASIDFYGTQMSVRKEITFHKGHQECDNYYGIGLSYSPGTK